MVRKRLDDRVRHLLSRAQQRHQRGMLILVGDYGKDQVPHLHRLMSQNTTSNPQVLWCYKKDLGFSTHQQKRMKKLKQKAARGLLLADDETAQAFDLFVSQAPVTWCYYKDSHRALGQTVQMLVLQDFEALTPNLLARTMETVSGGGLIVFLVKSVKSLQQLYHMTMDVHSRYRGAGMTAHDVVARFNERFLLSLADNPACLVCDDELNILPLSKKTLTQLERDAGQLVKHSVDTSDRAAELNELQESLLDTPHVGVLVGQTKTLDQAQAVLQLLDTCADNNTKNRRRVVAMTAARGRGKSAALGLSLAGALALGYSTIAVTAPTPENLVAVFDFAVRGLKELHFQEHLDFTVQYNAATGRDQVKCILSIQLHKTHRQVIQYVPPHAVDECKSAEIVAIDEAAAIPLPLVRALVQLPDRLVWLTSTVNGYEGTGRALSLKLIQELRQEQRQSKSQQAQSAAQALTGPSRDKGSAKIHEQRWAAAASAADNHQGTLVEVELQTPIRYATGDPIESWLHKLLCLESPLPTLAGGAPAPDTCELYSVNRDALFSYHKLSEAFLQNIMGLYTSAHYKNTPNDLQLLSDAPAHGLFVLLSPHAESAGDQLPDVLAVIQVSMEGQISRKAVEAQLARGHRAAGDLIPWTLSQQFGDSKFAQLSGARIVRIATHPSLQGMGYGSHAMQLLYRYYNGEMINLSNDNDEDDENAGSGEDKGDSSSDESDEQVSQGTRLQKERLKPRKELPPLLLPLTEVKAPKLDWIGTSFGLTLPLHKFWSRAGMTLLYARQTQNELTGEHSVIMVRTLQHQTGFKESWVNAFAGDTRRRIISLLSGSFRHWEVRLALNVLDDLRLGSDANNNNKNSHKTLARSAGSGKITVTELDTLLTPHDLKRLELYGRNLCDHHLITDLLSTLARLYFTERLGLDFSLSHVQAALLCGIGLQCKTVTNLSQELGLPENQTLAMFNKSVRKLSIALNAIAVAQEKETLQSERQKAEAKVQRITDVSRQTLEEDLSDGADQAVEALTKTVVLPPEISHDDDIMKYAVKGSKEQWDQALEGGTKNVQIQSMREKRRIDEDDIEKEHEHHDKGKKSKKKDKKRKKTRR